MVDMNPQVHLFKSFKLTSGTSYDFRRICIGTVCNFLVYSYVVGRFSCIAAVDALKQFTFAVKFESIEFVGNVRMHGLNVSSHL